MSHSVVLNENMFGKMVLTALLLVLMNFSLSGCSTVRTPAGINYSSNSEAESLSSNVSLAYASPDRNISGSGYLMFRKPDQIRAVILSPFGSVIQEVYVSGEQVTIIDAGNGIAFRGKYTDLPDKGDFSGWRYIHWLVEIDPPDSLHRSAVIERINRFGQTETATFENGLLISKAIATGGLVRYARYTEAQGVAFPLEIIYETVSKEKFTILLEDPEFNVPLADGAFAPNLSKFRVYPLSSLR